MFYYINPFIPFTRKSICCYFVGVNLLLFVRRGILLSFIYASLIIKALKWTPHAGIVHFPEKVVPNIFNRSDNVIFCVNGYMDFMSKIAIVYWLAWYI